MLMSYLRSRNIRTMSGLIAAAVGVFGLSSFAHAVDRTWVGAGSGGPLSWGTPANWSGTDVPDNTGENAVIGDTTGNRNIVTPATPTTINLLQMSQTFPAVNKVTLGNDLNVLGSSIFTVYNNTTGSDANLIVDLNGHNFYEPSRLYANLTGMTYTSSVPGSVLTIGNLYGGTGHIGPNVTLEMAYNGPFAPTGTTFDVNSKVVIPVGVTTLYYYGGSVLGNVDVGKNGNASNALLDFAYDYGMNVASNFTIYAPTGSTAANLQLKDNGTGGGSIIVAGNFIDHGAANAAGYGIGTIYFDGASATPRIVSIARTALTNTFIVGYTSPDTGNVKLANDLTTTGYVEVTPNSKLDVDNKTVNAGHFYAYGNMEMGLTIGTTDGIINVTNDLTLNAFKLDLAVNNFNLPAQQGDLILFTYGSLSGVPSVTFGSLPPTFSYGQLLYDNGTVRLTNVVIPEPASAALLVLSGVALLRRKRIVA